MDSELTPLILAFIARWRRLRQFRLAAMQTPHYLISNLRTTDQAPAVPFVLFARTRHHMRPTGSELMVVSDTLMVCVAISGEAMVLESSNWMV